MTTLVASNNKLTGSLPAIQVQAFLDKLISIGNGTTGAAKEDLSALRRSAKSNRTATRFSARTGWLTHQKTLGFEPTDLLLDCLIQQSVHSGISLTRWKAGSGDLVFELEVRYIGTPYWTLKSTNSGKVKVLWSAKEAKLENVLQQLAITGTMQLAG